MTVQSATHNNLYATALESTLLKTAYNPGIRGAECTGNWLGHRRLSSFPVSALFSARKSDIS